MRAPERTGPDQESLGEFLASRARRASDGRLALQTGGGLVVALGTAIWRGPGWVVPCAIALSASAFGAWGILDRELRERSATSRSRGMAVLRAARILAAAFGGAAAVAAMLAALALSLGTWIS